MGVTQTFSIQAPAFNARARQVNRQANRERLMGVTQTFSCQLQPFMAEDDRLTVRPSVNGRWGENQPSLYSLPPSTVDHATTHAATLPHGRVE